MKRGTLVTLCIAMAASSSIHAHADLVVNGGFEDTPATSGWGISGDDVIPDTTNPNNGLNDIAFIAPSGDPSPGILSQTLSTIAGQSYTLSFALLDASGWFADSFAVTLGGFSTTIAGSDAAPPGDTPNGYTTETFLVPAADIAGNDTLSFQGITDSGNFAATGWNLDDVSVAAPSVPEPSSVVPLGTALVAAFLAIPASRRGRRRV